MKYRNQLATNSLIADQPHPSHFSVPEKQLLTAIVIQ